MWPLTTACNSGFRGLWCPLLASWVLNISEALTCKQNTQTQNKNKSFKRKGQNDHLLSILDVLIHHINILSGHKHEIFIADNEVSKCWYLLVWGSVKAFSYLRIWQRPRPIFIFKSYLGGQPFWENILRCNSSYKNQSLSWLELTTFTAPPMIKFPMSSRSFPKASMRTIHRKLS